MSSSRVFVFILYVIGFIMSLYSLSQLSQIWNLVPAWTQVNVLMSAVLAFCGILVAYWVSIDDQRIKELEYYAQNPKTSKS